MIIQFPGKKPYSKVVKETSKKAGATDEQYDRILQNVLDAVGKPGEANYPQAAANVERMASANTNRIVNRVIASGTGMAVLAASLFLVINTNRLAPTMAPEVIIEDTSIPLSDLPDGFSAESLPPELASNPPVLDSIQADGEFIYIYISNMDQLSYWYSIFGVDDSGQRVEPVEVNPSGGYVKFALPADRLELYFEDETGAQTKMAVKADE